MKKEAILLFNITLNYMLFFYRYKKAYYKRMYKKAVRSIKYMEKLGKWYLMLKYCKRNTSLMPTIASWSWRSFYLNKHHVKSKELVKKAVLFHLFFVVDIWKLKQPMNLHPKATFPVQFSSIITKKDPLELYSMIHKWKYKYGFKSNKLYPYIITRRWAKYNSEDWMKRTYTQFNLWRNRYKKGFMKKQPLLTYLNKWFIEYKHYHSIQGRLRCHVPMMYPNKYTRTLWLRLLQYPVVYNYKWLYLLSELSKYGFKKALPWFLMYQNKDTWTFDRKAKALEKLYFALTEKRFTITEYILIKHWRSLLKNDDDFSTKLQISLRKYALVVKYQRRKNANVITY